MKDKSKLTAIILVIITLIVVITSFITKDKEESKVGDINIVTNYSNFYTVDSCLYRTINMMINGNYYLIFISLHLYLSML